MKIKIRAGNLSRNTTLAEFVRDNASAFTPADLRSMRLALAFGCVYRGGGGAAAAWEVSRAGAALSDTFTTTLFRQIDHVRGHKHATRLA